MKKPDRSREPHFPDKQLEKAVRDTLGIAPGDPIDPRALAALAELAADDRQICNLAGLEDATGLVHLSLADNEIEHVTALAGLARLETLFLHGNRFYDLSPLSGLARLRTLTLGGFWVDEDVGTLTLEAFGPAWGPAISNIAPLRSLAALETLRIDNHAIKDIGPLAHLTRLAHLALNGYQGGGPVKDWTPLTHLVALRELSLRSNALHDAALSALAALPNLHTVDLRGNPLGDQARRVHIPLLEAHGVRVRYDSSSR